MVASMKGLILGVLGMLGCLVLWILAVWVWGRNAVEDAAATKELYCLTGHSGCVNSVTISPDGRFALTAGSDKTIRLWKVSSGDEVRRFEGHTEHVSSAVFSPDGRHVLSDSGDWTMRLWETESGKQLRCFTDEQKKAGFWLAPALLSFTSDGNRIFCARLNQQVQILDATTLKVLRSIKVLDSNNNSKVVCFSPTGDFALVAIPESDPCGMYLWDITNDKVLTRFHQPAGEFVTCAAFVPGGQWVVSGSRYEGYARLWDIKTGAEVRRFFNESEVTCLAVSSDGHRLLVGTHGDDRKVNEVDGSDISKARCGLWLWDLQTGKEVFRSTRRHTSYITSVAISPDGRFLLSGSMDCTARLWNMPE